MRDKILIADFHMPSTGGINADDMTEGWIHGVMFWVLPPFIGGGGVESNQVKHGSHPAAQPVAVMFFQLLAIQIRCHMRDHFIGDKQVIP